MFYRILIPVLLLCISCSIEPVPIEYNVDLCDNCKMIIANERFGAELVTTKGRAYKFDALECLLPMLKENGPDHYKYILATDYTNARKFIEAEKATYLISKDLPSPMGAFLSAYSDPEEAEKMKGVKGGKIYTWKELQSVDLFGHIDY